MKKRFSIRQSFKDAWHVVKPRWALYCGITLVAALILFGLDKLSQSHFGIIALIAALANLLLYLIIGIGSINLILKDLRKEPVTYQDMFVSKDIFLVYVKGCARLFLIMLPFALVIGGLVAYSGLMLLGGGYMSAIPVKSMIFSLLAFVVMIVALFVGARYYFFPYFISDDKLSSSKQALARSKEVTKGAVGKLILFALLAGFINALASITYVGILITMPITMVATALIYKKLKETSGADKPAEAPIESTVVPAEIVS